MLSQAEENYLKAIYKWELINKSSVSTNQIADELQTKPASVSDMIKKLADKELCEYKKYKGVFLTSVGKKMAISIVRKHRLWEFFLHEKLGFGWEKVHPIAEQLEHIHSEELIERLDKFLEFPKWDPHGNPIPDKNGELPVRKNIPLSMCKKGDSCRVLGVKSDSPSLLTYLDKVNIKLGTIVKIEENLDFDDSFVLDVSGNQLHISKKIAHSLFVKIVK